MRLMLSVALAALILAAPARAADPDPKDWPKVVEQAKGQTVHWFAWGGGENINAYIAWAGAEIWKKYGVKVEHVKITDAAEIVARVLAEKTAGKTAGGAVDLIWINGENFAAMKKNGLLFGPWAESAPNFKYVDVEGKPTTRSDFTIPTDGLEAPWGMAQAVFVYDSKTLPQPPKSIPALLEWAQKNPGRFAYAEPPNFYGSTFLKQALYELIKDPAKLAQPVDETTFAEDTAPLWDYLGKLHPVLWRKGAAFPQDAGAAKTLLNDGEIDLYLTFNPAEASAAIEAKELSKTVRTFVLSAGTIGNTHFVAIPFNSPDKAGAMVVADFLMSPEAQARKQDPKVWGDPTVLNLAALNEADKARFRALKLGVATLSPDQLGKARPEPHPSWVGALEAEWRKRYAAGK